MESLNDVQHTSADVLRCEVISY